MLHEGKSWQSGTYRTCCCHPATRSSVSSSMRSGPYRRGRNAMKRTARDGKMSPSWVFSPGAVFRWHGVVIDGALRWARCTRPFPGADAVVIGARFSPKLCAGGNRRAEHRGGHAGRGDRKLGMGSTGILFEALKSGRN